MASQTLPLADVAELATSIVAEKLAQVTGVADVSVCGPEATTRITIDLRALAATGKTVDDVRVAIAATMVDDPGSGYRTIPIVRDTARIEPGDLGSCVAIGRDNARVVAVTVTPQVGADPRAVRERLEAIVPKLTAALPAGLDVDVWPRTRPFAYEVLLEPGTTPAHRIDQLGRALTALHLATRSLVQLGDPDRGPDVAALWIVPPEAHAGDLDEAVAPTLARARLTVLDRRDHVVGFSGADLVELSKEQEALVAALAKTQDLHVVERLGGDERPQPVFEVDRVRAATLGVSAHDLAATLQVLAPGGTVVSTTFTPLGQHRVMLAVNGQLPDVLDQVMVRSTRGDLVPLSAVTRATESRAPTVIFHEGQFPWLGVRVAGPLDALEAVLAQLPVPASIHRELREPG
jgi:multidrug efflux pump subunit AcrB